jgi:predicted permease
VTDWLFRLALRLVPASWRESVSTDIEEEARAQRRGGLWKAWQAMRVAGRWRSSFGADALWLDLKHGVRSLLHAPGFSAAAILTMVLGLGANIAVFTVVDRMLFRPLPFAHEHRLAMVVPFSDGRRYSSFSKRLFVESRRGTPAIEDMAFVGFTADYWVGSESTSLALTETSYNLLDVVGARPAAGRAFLREDAEQRRAVVMITYETWQSRFGGAPGAIGSSVRQDKLPSTIIGILPQGFIAPAMNRSRRFDGLFLDPQLLDSAGPKDAVDPAVARLAPGASIATAQAQLDLVAERLDPELGEPPTGRGPRVRTEPLRQGIFWRAHTYLWLVTLAAILVGVLACVNLAGLMVARGRSRMSEIALRTSLGASRGRMMLMECLQGIVLCVAATCVSLAVLYLTAGTLRALVPIELRWLVVGEIDVRVALFAAVAALVAGTASAAVPAWRASQAGLVGVLHRGGGASVRSRRLGGAAVLTAESAVGVVLVVAAAIVIRSFVGLATTDVGFQSANLRVVRVGPPGDRQGGDNRAELARYLSVLDEIRKQPGVVAAGAVDSMPSAGAAPMSGIRLSSGQRLGLWQMSEGLVPTLGTRLLAGRDITRAEVDAGQPLALLTRSAASALWPGDAPSVVLDRMLTAPNQPPRRVVGVLQDILDRPDETARPKVFATVLAEPSFWFLEFAVRIDPARFNEDAFRRALVAPPVVIGVNVQPAGRSAAEALEQPRAQAIIFGSFAGVGLLLAALGLFAVASFDVALRRPEMGLRMALGATQREIRGLVIRDALRPVAIGVGAGLVAAYWAATFAQTLVYETDVRDPWTLAVVAGVLLASAGLAAWLPARRASRVDPAVVLRAQ